MTGLDVGGVPVGFGVVGARSMVATLAVLPALERSGEASLVAAASAGGQVPDRWRAMAVDSYEEVLAHDGVEAVYIPLPNHLHLDWVAAALAAGKHVLCEKPLARTGAEARAIAALADRSGLVVAEAWMTPFDLRWQRLLDDVRAGCVGEVTAIESTFTFTLGAGDNYRWQPDQGGGALLDVGIYCLGAAVELWGPLPASVEAEIRTGSTGVDITTAAELRWAAGRVARVRCSFEAEEQQRLVVAGTEGTMVLASDAFTGGAAARVIGRTDTSGAVSEVVVDTGDPYLAMIDSFSRAVRGRQPWPRPLGRSIEMLDVIDRIREAA